MKVPFVDLGAQYDSIKREIDDAISGTIENCSFIGGPDVREFEKEFAVACGVDHCIGVGNGTDAIYVALKMLGIGQGDEVITVANSWISTSEAITQTGATPVFVDVDETFNIDTTRIEQKVNERTKAILPVHLYGQPADMGAVRDICDRHELMLLEDCAQAHLATFQGRHVGTFGNGGTFSFYPGKNLGAYGDAGCIITNDGEYAARCRMYANHGALKKHHHLMEGINSRLDGLQAAILRAKLPHLKSWTAARQHAATGYSDRLDDIEQIACPRIGSDRTHSFHLYVVLAEDRDELQGHLQEKGVSTAVHYPTPLPLLPAYSYLNHGIGDFTVSERNQKRILSLPMFPEISESMLDYVSDAIRDFYA